GRLFSLPGPAVRVCQVADVSVRGLQLFQFAHRFGRATLAEEGAGELAAAGREARVELQRLLRLLDRPVVIARTDQRDGENVLDDPRCRVEPDCLPCFLLRLAA